MCWLLLGAVARRALLAVCCLVDVFVLSVIVRCVSVAVCCLLVAMCCCVFCVLSVCTVARALCGRCVLAV